MGRASAILGAYAVRLLARHPVRDAVAGTVALPDLRERHGLAVCDTHTGVGLLVDSDQVHRAWSALGALDGLVAAALVVRALVVHLCDNGSGLGGTGHHLLTAATTASSAVEVGFEWTGPGRSPATRRQTKAIPTASHIYRLPRWLAARPARLLEQVGGGEAVSKGDLVPTDPSPRIAGSTRRCRRTYATGPAHTRDGDHAPDRSSETCGRPRAAPQSKAPGPLRSNETRQSPPAGWVRGQASESAALRVSAFTRRTTLSPSRRTNRGDLQSRSLTCLTRSLT